MGSKEYYGSRLRHQNHFRSFRSETNYSFFYCEQIVIHIINRQGKKLDYQV